MEAGTYKPFFESVIDTLAGVMELRDNAEEQFIEYGGQTIIEHTIRGGATNMIKNPALVMILDCNAQALTYWKELGLTSKAYKAMKGDMQTETGSSLEDLLSNMGI